MYQKKSETLTEYSKELRKNMTKEEKHLWYDFLKKLEITVHKQHTIGPYIADFYIAERKIVIELDGNEHDLDYDAERDKYMKDKGIVVLRYRNKLINQNFDEICEDIKSHLK